MSNGLTCGDNRSYLSIFLRLAVQPASLIQKLNLEYNILFIYLGHSRKSGIGSASVLCKSSS
jgi:hypothetical protein